MTGGERYRFSYVPSRAVQDAQGTLSLPYKRLVFAHCTPNLRTHAPPRNPAHTSPRERVSFVP